MRQQKTTLTDEQVEQLRVLYPTHSIIQLAKIFHVGGDRMREILVEHGMTERLRIVTMPSGRKSATSRCGNCKSISIPGDHTRRGWCMKFKRSVDIKDCCSEHAFERVGTFQVQCIPTR